MARKLLKINDSAWLFAETSRTPMQVGMLATFRVPEDRPTFVADLVRRWRDVREFQPPYNFLFKTLPVPSWVEVRDDTIDLDYHLRHSALPAPGSQRELGVLVSRLHSAKMDRRYPLWEVHVIEGLRDDETGRADRWALYMKAHHSQVDGVGGIRLLRRMFSVDPDARDLLPPWAVGTHGADQSGLPPREKRAELVPAGSGGVADLVGAGVRSSAAIAGSLGRTYAETLTGTNGVRGAPFRAPKSIFNGRIHTPRRFATQHYGIDRLRTLAKAADGSLNDVFLAVSGGALRRYLLEHDALPSESLTANVPVSVRAHEGAKVGNAVTFLFARLGTDVEDPEERFEAIKASTRLGKERLPEVGQTAMDAYTGVLMAPFLTQAILGVGGHGRPSANVVISNVPGPAETRYLDGSPMEEIFPVSLLFNGQALNITAVSYGGEFNIGYTGCRDSVPSLQRIAVYSGDELERLESAYSV
ncbi:wax ester/triacylglycerol synthase family O-acyltransferase [Nocardioides sp.]|uniref:WS/DGAT/MGAT family O-acyltransferase n=1 Tax=Nocardioides sp. TaxID=35761 RepID=UPI0027170CD6|nr:wax ester/triacylglycerol synthase family O-acyltransferase [Nocardioides sp.]MDO9458372.1 wax ester/triacylglycerol synthase family O-acyltransferase [Nocardioides sp.]